METAIVDKIYHKHLLVNAKVTEPIQSEAQAEDFMHNLVDRIEMNILQGPFVSYVEKAGNRGITSIVMIETSHISFHIWDEQDPAMLQFDLYTCGKLDKDEVLKAIVERFAPTYLEYQLFDRENGFVLEDKGKLIVNEPYKGLYMASKQVQDDVWATQISFEE